MYRLPFPRRPLGYHDNASTPQESRSARSDKNPGKPDSRRRADLSAPSREKTSPHLYEEFCATGTVPAKESEQSSLAIYCLKYGDPQSLAKLLNSGRVTSLDLSGSLFELKFATALANVLKANKTLQRICLADNGFGVEGLKLICGALEHNDTLIALNLGRNATADSKFVEAISEMIAKNNTLKVLELECSEITGEKVQILARALKRNHTLTELKLKSNCMGAEGTCIILEAVGQNPALKILDLEGNKIGPEGAKLIAGLLKTNSTLSQLNLASNGLGPDGANEILNAVQGNTTLRKLSLSYNGMDKRNASPVASLLQNNKALSSLDFSCNRELYSDSAPDNETIDLIVHGLQHNTSLTELNLAEDDWAHQLPESRSPLVQSWSRPQPENNMGKKDNLLQRNRILNALSEKDAQLASQLCPSQPLSQDEGRLLAEAILMASPSVAAYESTMVEIQCCVNVLASQT